MGKAFDKQIKTIEAQREKQIQEIQDRGEVRTVTKYVYDAEDTSLISKQKEIVDVRLEKIVDLDKMANSDDLIYKR